ncbi:MAG: radical SAM protein [Salinivirgaceae bacterium]|nr:radical SAM protein [Salinivirgaceae bacterium]
MKKQKSIDAIHFLKTLTLRKIINGLLLRLSYRISIFSGKHIHWGKPESLSIEPTNLCNLKCPECPSGNNLMTRSRLFLSDENYKKSISEFAPWLSNLILYFQGEPFMHPKIYDFIALATQKNIYTTTSTNGQFLSKENCEKIVKSGLKRLIVSIDGTDQNTYEKYRVGGSFNLVVSGIQNLVEAKQTLNKHTPYVIVQFVVFKTNEHQIDDIKKLCKKLTVDLTLKTAQIDDFLNGNELLPKNQKLSRYARDKNDKFHLKRKQNFKCWRVWNGSVISADNKLLPCCFDKNAEHSYGSPELLVWKNKAASDFRKLVWEKNTIEMCKNCSEGVKPITLSK